MRWKRSHPFLCAPRRISASKISWNKRLVGAIRLDNMAVPEIAVFQNTLFASAAQIVLFDIDQPVSLAHFRGGAANNVHGRPDVIPSDIHAVQNSFSYLTEVLSEIIDAVRIVDGAIVFDTVKISDSVFGNVDGALISVIKSIQHESQTQWVNGPAPGISWQVRVAVSVIMVFKTLLIADSRIIIGKC